MANLKKLNIVGLWNKTSFVCGNRDREDLSKVCGSTLELQIYGTKTVYRCPCCGRSVSYFDIEQALSKINTALVEDCDVDLTNMRWTSLDRLTGTKCTWTILSHTRDRIIVEVLHG